jgi:hypothetical protein
MTLATLDAMRNATEVDRANLVDIHTIQINKNLPAAQRAEQYLGQIRNPYCFTCGESVVRLRFNDEGGDLRSRLKNYFISCKKA